MSKKISPIAELRRQEQYNQLIELRDRDLCGMIKAHFESHPALPGEKIIKDTANQILAMKDDGQDFLTEDEKKILTRKYANTRIRETKLKGEHQYLLDPASFKSENGFTLPPDENNIPIMIHTVKAELQKTESGDVNVIAEQENGNYRFVGTLPSNFMVNNPMIVDHCAGELQIADYSNGKLKNISIKLIVDTDLMSNDVVDLDEDMLSGLDMFPSLEQ